MLFRSGGASRERDDLVCSSKGQVPLGRGRRAVRTGRTAAPNGSLHQTTASVTLCAGAQTAPATFAGEANVRRPDDQRSPMRGLAIEAAEWESREGRCRKVGGLLTVRQPSGRALQGRILQRIGLFTRSLGSPCGTYPCGGRDARGHAPRNVVLWHQVCGSLYAFRAIGALGRS